MTLASAAVGDTLEPLTRVADPERMKLMAALLRDPNPIHFDVESVERLGLGDRVIAQGPMTLSFVSDMVSGWAGGPQTLRSLEVRMLGNVFGGETVVCRGTVAQVDEGKGLVTVDVEATVGERTVVAGIAVVSR